MVGRALHEAVQDVAVLRARAGQHAPAGAEFLLGHQVVVRLRPGLPRFGLFRARDPVGNSPEHAADVAVAVLQVLAFGDVLGVLVEVLGGLVGAEGDGHDGSLSVRRQ